MIHLKETLLRLKIQRRSSPWMRSNQKKMIVNRHNQLKKIPKSNLLKKKQKIKLQINLSKRKMRTGSKNSPRMHQQTKQPMTHPHQLMKKPSLNRKLQSLMN